MERLDERGIKHSGVKDRGFMDSIYFEDPLGLLIGLAPYRFQPLPGQAHADVRLEAHKVGVERGDCNIAAVHPDRFVVHRMALCLAHRGVWLEPSRPALSLDG